ncbi:hypothetical protein MTO96_015263, partial [Rhipicephalus appendiculatus]
EAKYSWDCIPNWIYCLLERSASRKMYHRNKRSPGLCNCSKEMEDH